MHGVSERPFHPKRIWCDVGSAGEEMRRPGCKRSVQVDATTTDTHEHVERRRRLKTHMQPSNVGSQALKMVALKWGAFLQVLPTRLKAAKQVKRSWVSVGRQVRPFDAGNERVGSKRSQLEARHGPRESIALVSALFLAFPAVNPFGFSVPATGMGERTIPCRSCVVSQTASAASWFGCLCPSQRL